MSNVAALAHHYVTADREKLIFHVQLTTSRIGNLTRLIHTLAICVTIHTTDMNQRHLLLVARSPILFYFPRDEAGKINIYISSKLLFSLFYR